MTSPSVGYEDLRGVMGLIPTPATPDAHSVDARDTVDTDVTRRVVRRLVDAGVDGLVLNGTFGEAATLTDDEWETFTETAIEAADGDIPMFAGPTTLDTRTTIERMRFARDVGADGALVGRPLWCELDDAGTRQFYRTIAEAVPELAILVYYNPGVFKNEFDSSLWADLADIPGVVGAKYGTVDDHYHDVVPHVEGKLRLLTVEHEWTRAREDYGDYAAGCWSSAVSCGPSPVTGLRDAIWNGEDARATEITASMKESAERYYPGDRDEFERYVIPLTKVRIDAAGYVDPGPPRPPYTVLPDAYEAGARKSGRRWADLATSLQK